MTRLEKGMYVKVLKDIIFYDPNTLKPTVAATKDSIGEIKYVGFTIDLSLDESKQVTQKLNPILHINVKGTDIHLQGRMLDDFSQFLETL